MASRDFQALCPECHRPLPSQKIEWAGIVLDKPSLELQFKGVRYHVNPRQTEIIALLLERKGKLVSYSMIEDIIFGDHDLPLGFDILNNINQHSYQIRQKTGLGIHAVQGQGIFLMEPE